MAEKLKKNEKPKVDKLSGAKAVEVSWAQGSKKRVYSLEMHGEKFLALANQFAGKESVKGVVKRFN